MDVYILRHGDAEPRSADVPEAGRKLTAKGKRDVECVVALLGKKLRPDVILTSPYRRAVETAEIAGDAQPGKIRMLETPSLLPQATPQQTWKELRSFTTSKQILLAGHQPHLGQLIAYLLGTPSLNLDLKKGALVRIRVDPAGKEPQGELKWILTPTLARERRSSRTTN